MSLRSIEWLIDKGYVPRTIIKWAVRRTQKARQAELWKKPLAEATEEKMRYIAKLRTQPIAIETKAVKQQQYEIGTGVFASFLGPRMKYSPGLFRRGNETLTEAETAMLHDYIEKADLEDGMSILDLGCGWGSATLFLAEQFPNSHVIGISNSGTQRDYIEEVAGRREIKNIEVITGNIADYQFDAEQFDRVVSIGVFEHMKNYELLMARIADWLKPGGKLFVDIFTHRTTPYDYEDGWMTKHFFSGGTMPSADLLLHFQRHLTLQKQWWLSGRHYSKTLQCWLSSFLKNKESVWPHLVASYGEKEAATWYNRWVVYHTASAEFFATEDGEATGISHYLFEIDRGFALAKTEDTPEVVIL